MNKIGVFLGFQPGVNLSSEGIGRLLAFILKENDKSNESIVLFSPEWLKDSIHQLFIDNKILINKFEIVYTNNVPIGVKIKTMFTRKQNDQTMSSKFKELIKIAKKKIFAFSRDLLADFFGTSSIMILLGKALFYLLSIIIILPIAVLLGILFFLGLYLSNFFGKVIFKFSKKGKITNPFLSKIASLLNRGKGEIYQILLDNELNRLVKLVNKHDEVKVCFVPSMAWSQIEGIRCKKVVASPDIVFYDFPTQYTGVVGLHRRIRKSIEAADSLLCYSEYIKYHHLVEKCGVNPEKITVIKHANVNMSEYIKIPKDIIKYITQEQYAQQIVGDYIKKHYPNGYVLTNSNFKSMDFIIYSSQCRPHKNIFNLVKAIKIINKDMNRNVKLILTGNIDEIEVIPEYITANNLENDVFVMYSLSSKVLAAFNKLAKCAVNPTLFEGGFPFTFSEAYSVGTPSIISNIPVVYNEIDSLDLRGKMLFDPYNPYSIAEKIIWAIDNKETLYESQSEFYKKLDQRDWKEVVGEYNHVFRKLMV